MPINPWVIASIALFVITIGAVIAMYFVGQNMQKKQLAQREQMEAAAQPYTMMIIDKKMMKMKDAKLPKVVMDQTPKRYRNSKLPIVKAKIGPQIMTLIADDAIFDEIPTKGEVKAMVSGIYIISVKNVRGKVEQPTDKKKKKSLNARLRNKQAEYQKMVKEDEASKKNAKAEKAKEKKRKETASKIMK